MGDIKLYGKNDKEIDSLTKTVWQYSKDIKMEFGILKCAAVLLQRGRKTSWEWIQLPNWRQIGEAGAGGYKYLGVLELDKVMRQNEKEGERGISEKSKTAYEDSP